MSGIAGIDGLITFIYTPEPERSFRFYEHVLGLSMVRDEGAARIYRIAAGGYLGVCRESSERPCRPEGICISLVTDDVDGWFRRLAAKGAETDGPPQSLPEFGVYSFFLRDPDGHLIEVQRFDEGDWHR